ncbi:MAG: glycoside hydrolase family 2, partial [Bacteroidetes bacterium]|nr:glycoside hydrolase family 2 [Bacteroidota bacterium]
NPELPAGFAFDYINYDVIMNRMDVQDGRFVLPDGMSYRVMVLPESKTMRPELLEKIVQLVEKGGVILGSPPLRAPGMKGYPDSDQHVEALASSLWDQLDLMARWTPMRMLPHPVGRGYCKGLCIDGQ